MATVYRIVTAGGGVAHALWRRLGILVAVRGHGHLLQAETMDLSSARHAFITGGASGIGLGIADALVFRGLAVTIADIDQETLAAVTASRPDRYLGLPLDTRDRQGWASARAAAEARFGPVDILVNNAGIGPDGREMADMDPASFDRLIGINLTGVFNGISTFAAAMRARRCGHIVNVSSLAGLVTMGGTIGAYTAAKYGVLGMSEVLRQELAPHGVGVSVLCPGLVATNLGVNTAKLGSDIGDGGDPKIALSGGMDPARVGDMVVEAIAGDRFYIVTHPETWPLVQQRFREVEQAFASPGTTG